jgi:hypothetical protein
MSRGTNNTQQRSLRNGQKLKLNKMISILSMRVRNLRPLMFAIVTILASLFCCIVHVRNRHRPTQPYRIKLKEEGICYATSERKLVVQAIDSQFGMHSGWTSDPPLPKPENQTNNDSSRVHPEQTEEPLSLSSENKTEDEDSQFGMHSGWTIDPPLPKTENQINNDSSRVHPEQTEEPLSLSSENKTEIEDLQFGMHSEWTSDPPLPKPEYQTNNDSSRGHPEQTEEPLSLSSENKTKNEDSQFGMHSEWTSDPSLPKPENQMDNVSSRAHPERIEESAALNSENRTENKVSTAKPEQQSSMINKIKTDNGRSKIHPVQTEGSASSQISETKTNIDNFKVQQPYFGNTFSGTVSSLTDINKLGQPSIWAFIPPSVSKKPYQSFPAYLSDTTTTTTTTTRNSFVEAVEKDGNVPQIPSLERIRYLQEVLSRSDASIVGRKIPSHPPNFQVLPSVVMPRTTAPEQYFFLLKSYS